MTTFSQKPADVVKKWVLIDAEGLVVGRLATVIANHLRGKHKPTFTPHIDGGDFVVVVNAEKVKFTGTKLAKREIFRHTGYMGHERFTPLKSMMAKHPDRVIEKAVFGMLPKNSLSKQRLRTKLKVYAGDAHPHSAQSPKPYPMKVSA